MVQEKLLPGRTELASLISSQLIWEQYWLQVGTLLLFLVLAGVAWQGAQRWKWDRHIVQRQHDLSLFMSATALEPSDTERVLGYLVNDVRMRAKMGKQVLYKCLASQDFEAAGRVGHLLIEEAVDLLPAFYERFSRASLLIVEGKKEEALREALSLKSDLEDVSLVSNQRGATPSSDSLLYAYNLLRIALLQEELAVKTVSFKDDLLLYLRSMRGKNFAYGNPDSFLALFQDGALGLEDFIDQNGEL